MTSAFAEFQDYSQRLDADVVVGVFVVVVRLAVCCPPSCSGRGVAKPHFTRNRDANLSSRLLTADYSIVVCRC
ncbi:unnamed protein product [Haemonchus placei]|uniref:Uncharacterized protein n=1 Tax=Haemonchus placei TaxID=6290 RepID=A0A0N4XAA0_HAEPC|nr:unnamed protein product [Haemonchus placei]